MTATAGAAGFGAERPVRIQAGEATLDADLAVPSPAHGVVLFAHGSGSSRHSPRNRHVAARLREEGLATVMLDLLTPEEERVDVVTRELRFDIPMLAGRLVGAVDWLGAHDELSVKPVGAFGASTGAAAALIAAAERPDAVRAVVSRGGRPDLAGDALPRVRAPILLIVGSLDQPVIELNQDAMGRLEAPYVLEIVSGATHLFEEPGKLDEVADLAASWFRQHLSGEAG